MSKNPKQALKELKDNKYSPIYFLQGQESYYIDLIVNYIEKNLLSQAEKTLDQIIIYGKETNINQIIAYSNRVPMIASKQLVIVKEAQDIQDLTKENGKKLLNNYIDNPSPRTILVFAYKNKTIDGRSPLSKKLSKNNYLITSKKLYDNQIPEWINAYTQENGLSITPKAISMIIEYVGNNLLRISNEITKICINIKQNKTIDDNTIQKYVGISKDFNIFELQKALIEKNVKKAFTILNYFESNPKANPLIPMISIIYSFFVKIMQIHTSKDKSKTHIASLLKINPYFVNDYIKAAKNYPLDKIIFNINKLHEADLKIKNINKPQNTESQISKELLVNILN